MQVRAGRLTEQRGQRGDRAPGDIRDGVQAESPQLVLGALPHPPQRRDG